MAAQSSSPKKNRASGCRKPIPRKNPRPDTQADLLKLLKILDSLQAIVYVADMQSYELLFVNSYARDLFGDIEGEICWQSLQKDQTGPCPFCSNDKLVDKNGQPVGEYIWEFCNTRNNHWYRMVDQVIEWVDGRLVRLQVATDITERKLAEERVDHTQEELVRTNEQLALLLDALPIIPFTRAGDTDFTFTYMSNTVKEITGYPPKQFLDNPRFWLDNLHPEDRTRAVVDLDSLRAEKERKSECRFQLADGSYKWFASNLRAVRDGDGGLRYIVGTWQDISEEKRKQHESEQRLQQIIQADKLASLGQVVAGVAHEINNPNSFITYNVPLLEDSWEAFSPIIREFTQKHPNKMAGHITFAEMAEDMGEIITAIKTGSDRINAIVAKLKDFARLDEATPSKLVDINKVINDSLTIVGAQARKLIGTITVELAENLPLFYGHFLKLEQVVANLILNAAQAVPSKTEGTLSLRSRYIERLDTILIEIEDNGRGILPEDMDHIFDPFFTTKRNIGGTGLGLSVSYSLIQEHNGRIGVLSRPGLGTKFTLFLPVDRRESPLDLHPTILCVDDNPLVLGLLKSFFVGVQKMPVELMKSGDEVLRFLEEHPEVDLVLSDIVMPGIDGWQLLENIKEKFPLLPVILISGDTTAPLELKKQKYPPDHFMAKPLNFPKLITVINTIGRQRL
ncbi:MAG: response regulator [Proteobacteria bacterium]|nr:response regulator [Pseudomonadota bacterium]